MEKGSRASYWILVQACRKLLLANPERQFRDVTWWASARKSVIPCLQEKLLNVEVNKPYYKPTQVGRMKILRRLRELRRRNSANLHRNFGIMLSPIRFRRRVA